MAGKVEGLKELERKLAKLGDFPKDMSKELRAANRRIARIGGRVIKNKLPQGGDEFVVYKKRRKGIQRDGQAVIEKKIPKGTLRRSIRVWNSRGSKVNVQVGPRRGGSVRFDGYFAPWVESGNVGKKRRTVGSRFYDKIEPAIKLIRPRLQQIQLVSYRRIYGTYVNRLK